MTEYRAQRREQVTRQLHAVTRVSTKTNYNIFHYNRYLINFKICLVMDKLFLLFRFVILAHVLDEEIDETLGEESMRDHLG